MPGRARVSAAASVVAFVALAIAAHGDSTLPGDQRMLRWILGRDWVLLDSLTRIANWSTRSLPLIVAGAVLAAWFYLRGDRRDAVLLVAALIVMHASYPLKEIIASARPPGNSGESFGFPGGRAGNAVLVCGAIATIVSRRLRGPVARTSIALVAIGAVLLTGLARIRVGAHWPSDVLGAWLWTFPALVALIRIITPAALPNNPADRGPRD